MLAFEGRGAHTGPGSKSSTVSRKELWRPHPGGGLQLTNLQRTQEPQDPQGAWTKTWLPARKPGLLSGQLSSKHPDGVTLCVSVSILQCVRTHAQRGHVG